MNQLKELKEKCIRLGYQNALGDISKWVDATKDCISPADILLKIIEMSAKLESITYDKVIADINEATPQRPNIQIS